METKENSKEIFITALNLKKADRYPAASALVGNI